MKVLSIDIGGTHVKVLAPRQREPRKAASGSSRGRYPLVHLEEVHGDSAARSAIRAASDSTSSFMLPPGKHLPE